MGGSLPPEGLIANWRPTNLALLITHTPQVNRKGAPPSTNPEGGAWRGAKPVRQDVLRFPPAGQGREQLWMHKTNLSRTITKHENKHAGLNRGSSTFAKS